MGEVINLTDQLAQLEDSQEFVADLCRFSEDILSESAVRKKYRLSESSWSILGENDSLVEKIEAEKVRRIRDGSSKREKAQLLVTRAPEVVSAIMLDNSQNARHRIDSAKALNDFAADPMANSPAAAADRFVINIDLSGGGGSSEDILRFNKSIAIDVNDNGPVSDRTGKLVEHETDSHESGRPLEELSPGERDAVDALLGMGE